MYSLIKKIALSGRLPRPGDIHDVLVELANNPTAENCSWARHVSDRMSIAPWFCWNPDEEEEM
jgi:hypothetical protein